MYGLVNSEKLQLTLLEFFRIYIDPLHENSAMYVHREWIRESKYLNKLIYDNTSGLRLIFEKSKDDTCNLFNFESVL